MPDSNAPSASLIPLYRQVSDKLSADIADGTFGPGDALPSEHALCTAFGVSRITIRKALDELVARRLVVRRHGVGTFVAASTPDTWSVTLTGIIEDVITPNDIAIRRAAETVPPAEVLEFAGLPPKSRLWQIEAVNHVGPDTPLVYVNFFFPLWIAEQLSVEALSGSIQAIKVVESRTGCKVDHADQIVRPALASRRVAQNLKITPNSPVLRAIRVYYDTQGRQIEIFDAVYHPANYRYTARLYPRS